MGVCCSCCKQQTNYNSNEKCNNVIFYRKIPNTSCSIQALNKNVSRCKSIHISNQSTIFRDINDKFYVITKEEGNGSLHNNFASYNSNIKRIFSSPFSKCVFWLTDDNILFGPNRIQNASIWNNPLQIDFFKETAYIQDIQCSSNYCVALCGISRNKKSLIIAHWCKLFGISGDIKHLLLSFCDGTSVYSTLVKPEVIGGHIWKEIDLFVDSDIDKISIGGAHSLFLKSNQTVWACGNNEMEQCAKSKTIYTKIVYPTEIEYFSIHNIKIKQIVCGYDHNLVLDTYGNVHSWGNNEYFQCGHKKENGRTIVNPQMIQFFLKYNIQHIDCGIFISYCKSVNDKHFIFGEWSTQFTIFGCDHRSVVYGNDDKIHSVNFKKLTNGRKIKSVLIDNINAIILID